ncbi:hypothetical protein HZB96_04380 [Candidatus Gottesmanbacteria bacterium]|nr:hypothetical protein [Candidatus Gottesmanbacteria bacterium]
MASESVRRELESAEGKKSKAFSRKQEGVPQKVTIIGAVYDITKDLIGGLQSGLSYGGVVSF